MHRHVSFFISPPATCVLNDLSVSNANATLYHGSKLRSFSPAQLRTNSFPGLELLGPVASNARPVLAVMIAHSETATDTFEASGADADTKLL